MADESLQRARKLEASGDIDGALAVYRAVDPASPSFPESRIRIVGIALMRGDAAGAERMAKEFVELKPQIPDSHATLGQVHRFTFRTAEAVEDLARAVALAPGNEGFLALLHEARRAHYWSPDPYLLDGLRELSDSGKAGPLALARYYHALLLGLLNPHVQRWLTEASPGLDDSKLPDKLRAVLDTQFEGRYSAALHDMEVAAAKYHEACPPEPGRILLKDGTRLEGPIGDTDSTVSGTLEAVDGSAYVLIPWAEIRSVELGKMRPFVAATLTPRTGAPRDVAVPARYFFTEGCRQPDVRDGRRTAWRQVAEGVRVGIGLRHFEVGATRVGIDQVRRIEFT